MRPQPRRGLIFFSSQYHGSLQRRAFKKILIKLNQGAVTAAAGLNLVGKSGTEDKKNPKKHCNHWDNNRNVDINLLFNKSFPTTEIKGLEIRKEDT